MIQRICCAVILVGLSAAAAAAQVAPSPMLPGYEISTIVRSTGFTPISPAMRRGDVYVLRAVRRDGREMRVVVDARSGAIMSAAPVMATAPMEPGERLAPGQRLGPYERMDGPPGYVYEDGPPVVYEGDRPTGYERRPMAPIPGAPPRTARAVEAEPDERVPAQSPINRQPPIMQPERGDETGLLPPPPERFPQRATPAPVKPAAKPAPVKRAAAAPVTPLPKPRPQLESTAAPSASPSASPPETAPAPAPVPEGKVDARSLPH